MFPDYENCIAGIPNSVLGWYHLPQQGKSLKLLDSYLAHGFRNTVIILLDGMGKVILERNLAENGFFRSHLAGVHSSVFPPTTVAATTSISCGKFPAGHAWLGWNCYYPQIDREVTVFMNTIQDTDEPAADYRVAETFCGYENVIDTIKRSGGQAWEVSPFSKPKAKNFDEFCTRIRELCEKSGRKYLYCYWPYPDHDMHEFGCYTVRIRGMLRELEEKVRLLCNELEDTLVIVTADHGLIDPQCVSITDYPKICECFYRMPTIESRALALFVKPDMRKQFEREFKTQFGKDFLLWTKEEVIERQIFGPGPEHPNFRGMLGDYLAIAVGSTAITNDRESAEFFKGVHAGMTEDEMIVPLIVIETTKKS